MKFTVQKKDVVDVLAKLQGLTSRKSNLAITANILISASDAGLVFAATDLESGFDGRYPAQVEKPGTVVVNARKFFEIVREFPTDDIVVAENENRWIEIGNDRIKYSLVGMNSEDFPEIPSVESVVYASVESAAFKKMIERALMVGTSDDKRAHILGVYMEKVETETEQIIRMASTDGSRLSKVDYVFDKAVEIPFTEPTLIPKKGLAEVHKFLDAEGTVDIGLHDNHFVVRKDAETIIIRTLDGDFPKYADIVEIKDNNVISLERNMFQMMLKRISILSTDTYRAVIFKFTPGHLILSSTNPDIGEAQEDADIEYSNEPIEAAFNPRYFLETISVLDDDQVVLHIVDGDRPCLIEGKDDQRFVSVIMPMRI